ncbi:protein Spindly isoform X2 [Trematomus bernacchii]|uniref:protein Spindly isoform X2 n=1 Tax=Trematomus bernacchii TaxID=40690 RepID=UPI00146D1081|nr:protein Spindly isoform X2 [Trematomus bernacchii]
MATEEETQRLRSQLREREEQVHQAAQAGLDLLKQQMELQSRLDEQRVEMTNALEVLEQEKYSLQKEVVLKTRIFESLQSDFECLKSQQSRQLEEQQEHLERSRTSALTELNNKLLALQSALEESQLSKKQLEHKLEVQTETLNNKMEELRALNENTQSSMTSEMMEVQLKIMELETLKLEDKRGAMEKQLIGMKVQYLSLQKQHAFSKQQLQRMKVQIATLMQLQGSRADPAQLERLQSMLSEKNGEIQNLMMKLQRLEKVEMLLKSQPANPVPAEGGEGQDETYYTDLLKMKLSNTVKDAERLGDELSLQRMKSLSESQRALELERKLYSSERLLKQTQSAKIKLQLRVEELQHKYEPKAKTNQIQKRKKEKLPFDITPPSEETMLQKGEQVVAMSIDVTNVKNSDAEVAETESSTKTEHTGEPRPAKRVKISDDKPTEIPNPSSPGSDCKEVQREGNQQQNKREERRKIPRAVEVIHVGSTSSMETQCAQQ